MGRGPHRREPHLNSSASTLNGKPALLKDLALPERVADYPKQRYMGSIESRIISRHSKQREDCFQKAVIKRGLRCMRRSALRARSFSSP